MDSADGFQDIFGDAWTSPFDQSKRSICLFQLRTPADALADLVQIQMSHVAIARCLTRRDTV